MCSLYYSDVSWRNFTNHFIVLFAYTTCILYTFIDNGVGSKLPQNKHLLIFLYYFLLNRTIQQFYASHCTWHSGPTSIYKMWFRLLPGSMIFFSRVCIWKKIYVHCVIAIRLRCNWLLWCVCVTTLHCAKKPVTTMLTYPWKCTVLHCNHLGNTWKPLVLMTWHFDYCPSASEGDNQSVRSSAPVVFRCFPGGYNVKLYISRGRLAWWLLAFLHSVMK